MRNIKPLTSIIYAILCLALFTQCRNSQPNDTRQQQHQCINPDSIRGIRIVYIDLDTVMYRYKFALDINKEMISKEAKISATLENKRKKIEEEISQFEYKCNARTFASEDEFVQAREEIVRKEKEFMTERDELYAEWEQENMARGKELRDSINNFILEHNKEKGYDFILTKIGDNILFANEAFDITMEIVNGLNKRYKSKIRQ